MLEMINKILFFIKIILLLFVLTLTLYIMMCMYDYYQTGFLNMIAVCLPLILVLVIFVLSFFFPNAGNHTLFNLASFLALIAILIIDCRSIFDKNMVLWIRGNINFYYFQNQMMQIKILSYGIFLGNLILIYQNKRKLKKEH